MTDVKWSDNTAFAPAASVADADYFMGLKSGSNSKTSALVLTSYLKSKLGLGSGTQFLGLDQDYVLTSPLAKFIVVSIPSPGRTVTLPNPSTSPAIVDGTIVEITGDITGSLTEIKTHLGNTLLFLAPGETYVLIYSTNVTGIDGWIPQPVSVIRSWGGSTAARDITAGFGINIDNGVISTTGEASGTLQTDYDNGDGSITSTDVKPILFNIHSSYGGAHTLSSDLSAIQLFNTSGNDSDEKNAAWLNSIDGIFSGAIINDAKDTGINWLEVHRTGMNIDLIKFLIGNGAPVLQLDSAGNVNLPSVLPNKYLVSDAGSNISTIEPPGSGIFTAIVTAIGGVSSPSSATTTYFTLSNAPGNIVFCFTDLIFTQTATTCVIKIQNPISRTFTMAGQGNGLGNVFLIAGPANSINTVAQISTVAGDDAITVEMIIGIPPAATPYQCRLWYWYVL